MYQNSLIGQRLGRYEVRELLGRGGMASVYRAFDSVLGREVALKVLYPHFTGDQANVERFLHEARTVARLDHPNIVPIYDVVQHDGMVYIAMKLLQGQSLQEMLSSGRNLSLRQALALADQVARALDYAHSRSVVHRDIKPANIFIERLPDGESGTTAPRALLTDFGIAKSLDTPGMTSTGIMVGTPDYMAPEQIRGGVVDGRADVYALGMLLYRALSGQLPFHGGVQEVLMAQLTQQPLPPSHAEPAISPAVDAVIMRALAKDPAARYPSAGALVAALAQAARGGAALPIDQQPTVVVEPPPPTRPAATSRPPAPPSPAPRPSQSQRVDAFDEPQYAEEPRRQSMLLPGILLALVAALTLALVGTTFGFFGGRGNSTPSPTSEPVIVAPPTETPIATGEPTPAPTLEPTQDPAAGATEVPPEQATQAPEPSTQAPTQTPAVVTVVVTQPPPPPPTPTSTPEPSATSLPPTATATATPEPPTVTPEPPTPTATSTPDPLAACDRSLLQGGIGALWNKEPSVREALGCPKGGEQPSTADGAATNASQRDFERGAMAWWGPARTIYVFVGSTGGSWSSAPDTYQEGETLPTAVAAPPDGRYVPGRGFGKLWLQDPKVQAAVGYSTEMKEKGVYAVLQQFERGQMLFLDVPAGKLIYVLLDSSKQFSQYPDPTA